MIMKAFAAAALVVSQIPVVPVVQPASVEDARVLRCDGYSGTVWRISGDRYITADHVSGARSCTMDGTPARVIHRDLRGDFAVISTSRGSGREYEIDCGGYAAGQFYRAIGWAGGRDLLALPVVASGSDWIGTIGNDTGQRRFHRLSGIVYPGMSGGPVINREGKVVGIVNAGSPFGLFLSRPLSETALCDGTV